MAVDASASRAGSFDPASFATFRFTSRELDSSGRVQLRYALDDRVEFVETFQLPIDAAPSVGAKDERGAGAAEPADRDTIERLLLLLHWVAGVSYYKTAAPPAVGFDCDPPPPATAALLEALYSYGLGEFAYVNALPQLPHPSFGARSRDDGQSSAGATAAAGSASPAPSAAPAAPTAPPRPRDPRHVLVPVGGGKDSAVAIEIVRDSGCELSLFSVGDATAIARTAHAAGLPRLVATRRLDPRLAELNRAGALNGHVPITAIVACAALLTAALNGYDAVALANERSASSGNLVWNGVEINHQFSKGAAAEALLRGAVHELAPALDVFSVLRPASELSIARAFARLTRYHGAFTSCNAVFRLDPQLRASSWCCECPKCRFVFLALAPFSDPSHLREIFGRDLLEDESQYEGFALLTATGGEKPFECVGEARESVAAIRLLAADERWREHRVVRRLAAEVLPRHPEDEGALAELLALRDERAVPESMLPSVRALLAA